ncbi:DinB family protein, partial [[Eubacterium] siraeum]|nr:DinB family protein [[Eubacterium] siraeum]
VLSDKELLDYLHKVKIKTENYLDNLSDEDLNEKPDGCEYTRLELILGQFRHISSHIGMINGQTIERKGRFPVFSGLVGKQTDKLYDE